MHRKLSIITILTLGLGVSVQAETLTMPPPQAEPAMAPTPVETPVTEESESTPLPAATGGYSVRLPGRGMTMTQVEENFGPPREKLHEVGEPPIIRWNYDTFSVYFEYQFVINAVAHHGTN